MPLTETNMKEIPANERGKDVSNEQKVEEGSEINNNNINWIEEITATQTDGGNTLFVLRIQSRIAQIGKQNKAINLMCREKLNNQGISIQDSDTDCATTTKETKKSKRRAQKTRKRRENVDKFDTNMHLTKRIGSVELSPTERAFITMSDEIMMNLQKFRDNGKWEIFEEKTREMTEQYSGNWEAEKVILLEKSMALCYQNKLEESREMIAKLEDDIAEGNNVNAAALTRRCKLYKSGVHRKMRNQTGLADEYTTAAEQINTDQPVTLDDTFIVYERACVLMDFCSQCSSRNRKSKMELKDKAKACLKQCIDMSMRLEDDEGANTRYIKKHHFALIKIAMLVLECRTTSGRKKELNDSTAIGEAKDCLKTLRQPRYWENIATGEKVQYYLGESDLHWRQKDYHEAKKSATEAYTLAEKYGFETEVGPARERLDEIESKLNQNQNDGLLGDDLSDGELGDLSSFCDSDSPDCLD